MLVLAGAVEVAALGVGAGSVRCMEALCFPPMCMFVSLFRTPPPPSSAGNAPQDNFHVGMHVTVQGVVARPELNGRTGVCQAFDHQSGRWTIRFDLDDTLVKLQAEKLRALAQVLQPHARAERPALTLCVCVLQVPAGTGLQFKLNGSVIYETETASPVAVQHHAAAGAPYSSPQSPASSTSFPASACVVCMSDPPTHAFIPCGHKQICAACAADAAIVRPCSRIEFFFTLVQVRGLGAKCPTCRRNFQSILHISE